MNTIICIKQVLDPEISPDHFQVDPMLKTAVRTQQVSFVLDPYSEFAVEAALKIKDANGGKAVALALGTHLERSVVKKPVAMGVDELVLLEDESFEGGDSWSTAFALAKAIDKIPEYNLILCGREDADWNAGQVGAAIAEVLAIPCVTLAQEIEIVNGKAKVQRRADDGYEIVEVSLPALITVSNEIGEPRYPTLKGIMASKKVNPVTWSPDNIGVDASEIGARGRRTELIELYKPVREGKCEIIEGETPEERGVNLALRLREAKKL